MEWVRRDCLLPFRISSVVLLLKNNIMANTMSNMTGMSKTSVAYKAMELDSSNFVIEGTKSIFINNRKIDLTISGQVDLNEVFTTMVDIVIKSCYKQLFGMYGSKPTFQEVEHFLAKTITSLKYTEGFWFGKPFIEYFHQNKNSLVKGYYKYAKVLAQNEHILSEGEIDGGYYIIKVW